MISKEVKEKIENGEIKIENGRLINLGITKESISIEALDKLFSWTGKEEVAFTLSDLMSAIAQVLSECSFAEENASDANELKKIITENIIPIVNGVDIFTLNIILKAFIA